MPGVMQDTGKANAEADVMYGNSRATGIALVILAVVVAVLLTLLLVRNVLRQLGKDPGELNAIAHRVVDGDYNIDDGGKKMGVYGNIVEMVGALKNHIENAQRESENAREQSRKAEEAMRRAEAAGEQADILHPGVPYKLRVAIEREARAMSGYRYGRDLANEFMDTLEGAPKGDIRGAMALLIDLSLIHI